MKQRTDRGLQLRGKRAAAKPNKGETRSWAVKAESLLPGKEPRCSRAPRSRSLESLFLRILWPVYGTFPTGFDAQIYCQSVST